MLLSQLRWLGALAIGVAVMIAMYMDPEVKAPGGQPASPPSQAQAATPPSQVVQDESARLDAYRRAREALIANTPQGPVREAALAALRRQYFPPENEPGPKAPLDPPPADPS